MFLYRFIQYNKLYSAKINYYVYKFFMAISETKLNQVLINKFPDAEIKIIDLAGDQDHYSLEIKSSQFEGLTIIQQHKLVKKALADVLVSELHAITIKTKIY